MKPVKDERTGTYKVRWRVKRGDTTTRHKKTFKRRKDAVDFIENLQAERSRDAYAARRTVGDYAERYLSSSREGCKARTVDGYERDLRHARSFFGGRAVGTLRASDADAYLVYLNKAMPNCKVRSIRSTWRTFTAMLDMAVRDEALPSNPARKVKLPTANGRGEVKFRAAFLNPEQVERVAAELVEPYGLLVRFAAYSGLRRGEIAGLNIAHLTLLFTPNGWRGRVKVEQTARYIKGSWVLDTPKTDKSTRDVPLPGWLAEELHEYVRDHPNGRDPAAPLWPGRQRGGTHHGDVTYDQRWEPESFCRNIYAPAVQRAKVGKVRFHDLRHTFASLCAANSVPVERVSAWMGHSSIVITWSTYTHLFRGEDDHTAVEALGRPTARAKSASITPRKRGLV